jgi:hypothetical protein
MADGQPPSRNERKIDLDAEDFKRIKDAASKSPWMPPDYMQNDWIADVCRFLQEPRTAERPTPRCSCYVLPHAEDCALFVGVTQSGELVFAEEPPELIRTYGDAMFDCGNWNEEDDEDYTTIKKRAKDAEVALVAALSETQAPEVTAKFLEECGYVRKGGPRLTYQGGDNIAPTAIEYYNPETGHAVLEFVSVQPLLLEKGKESQYVKRYLYWAALTQEKR